MKCATLNSWVKSVTEGTFRTQRWTWYIGTIRWLRRYFSRLGHKARFISTDEEIRREAGTLLGGLFPTCGFPESLFEEDGWKLVPPRTAAAFLIFGVWKREERVFWGPTARDYIYSGFMHNRICQKKVGGDPGVALGLSTIVQCRIGGFWTAERRARRKLIHSRYLTKCPCCHLHKPETLFHLLWECPRWNACRAAYLEPLRSEIEVILDGRDDSAIGNNVVVLLLGGEVGGRSIQNWLYEQSDLTDLDELPITDDDSGSEGSEDSDDHSGETILEVEDGTGACLRVALYLSYVVRARVPIMSALRPREQCALSTSDRSSDG